MRFSLPLLAGTAALAVTAPASADDLTLDVMAHGTISTHSGFDDGTASEVVDASADLEQQITGLHLADGQQEATSRWTSQRVFATQIAAGYTQRTPERTLRWSCKAYGEAGGAAGEVRVRREAGDLLLDVGIQDSLQGSSVCSGDIETGASHIFMDQPFRTALRVPESALSDGSEVVDVRGLFSVCTRGATCQAVFNGSVVLRRKDVEVPVQQPPATPGKPKVKAKRTKQGAKVTVTCGAGCGGRISALAVAKRKQRQLAAKPFTTGTAASKVVVLRFPKHKGPTVITVRATPRGGSATTQKLRLR